MEGRKEREEGDGADGRRGGRREESGGEGSRWEVKDKEGRWKIWGREEEDGAEVRRGEVTLHVGNL